MRDVLLNPVEIVSAARLRACLALTIVLAAMLGFWPQAAFAQQDNEAAWADCGKFPVAADKEIAACTAYIDTGEKAFRAFALGSRGQAYATLGQDDQALADFDAAVSDYPKLTFALIGRARLFIKRGDMDKALADLDSATAASPDYGTAFFERGDVYASQGDFDRAIGDFSKSIELDKAKYPDEFFIAPAYNARGKAYLAKGDAANAGADLERAHQLDPGQFAGGPAPETAPQPAPQAAQSAEQQPSEPLAAPAAEPEAPAAQEAPAFQPAPATRLTTSELIAFAILAAIGLAILVLLIVARRQKPIAGPHVIELPQASLDPLESQFSRILPIGVSATSGAQSGAAIFVLGIFGAVIGATLWVVRSAGATGLPLSQVGFWTTLAIAATLTLVFAALPILNLILASVPRAVSRVGGLPLLILFLVGLILAPFNAISGLHALQYFDDPVVLILLVIMTLASAALLTIVSFGMVAGVVTVMAARDKTVELMRATPSSRSFARRVLAQAFGLPPIFEYVTRPFSRFAVIVIASTFAGLFTAGGAILAQFGAQIALDSIDKTAGAACHVGHCDSSFGLMFVLISPLFFILLPVAFLLLGGLIQRGVQRLVLRSLEQLQRTDPRPPLLFLRAFGDDQVELPREKFSVFGRVLQLGRVQRNLDHLLLEEVTPYGPHVALGNPKDPFPPYGAARGYFKNKTWQQAVADLARDSRAIILCVDSTDGVWWEVDHIAKADHIEKTLFLVHPKHRSRADNGELFARLAQRLDIALDIADALKADPPPKPRPRRPAATVLGFFVTGERKIQLIYSSTFSRLAYLLAVRFFIRSRIGLSPVAVARAGEKRRAGVA